MSKYIAISNRFAPTGRPGGDILLRSGEYSFSQVAHRDLVRYYELLEIALRGLRGRFKVEELEALASALEGMAKIYPREPIYRVPVIVEEGVRYDDLCARSGIEDCEGFLQRVRDLDLAARYALVDAIGRYLVDRSGEEGWKKVGLL